MPHLQHKAGRCASLYWRLEAKIRVALNTATNRTSVKLLFTLPTSASTTRVADQTNTTTSPSPTRHSASAPSTSKSRCRFRRSTRSPAAVRCDSKRSARSRAASRAACARVSTTASAPAYAPLTRDMISASEGATSISSGARCGTRSSRRRRLMSSSAD